MSYTLLQRELLVEAKRVAVGVAGARIRSDVTDTRFLLAGYINQAVQRGLSVCEAWELLAVAALTWLPQLAVRAAAAEAIDAEQVVMQLGEAAAAWAVDGGW